MVPADTSVWVQPRLADHLSEGLSLMHPFLARDSHRRPLNSE